MDVHDDLRLEGRFFNIHAEGRRVRDPLVLGLQWMIDFDKDAFRGCEAIKRRRAAGLKQKIIGVAAEPGCEALQTGAAIFHEGRPVAEVVASWFLRRAEPARWAWRCSPSSWPIPACRFRLARAGRADRADHLDAADHAQEPDGEAGRNVDAASTPPNL